VIYYTYKKYRKETVFVTSLTLLHTLPLRDIKALELLILKIRKLKA